MSHYFDEEPITRRLRVRKFEVIIRGFRLTFAVTQGVFSSGRVDPGTRLLAENMIIEDGWAILDMGCGYGVLGILAAKLAPHGRVVMVDINKLAVRLAMINVRLNGVKNVEVRHGDLYEAVKGENFDTIITNPPVSAGLGLNERLIRGAYDHLKEGGLLQIVVPKKVRRRFEDMIEDVFGNYEVLTKSGTHIVYVARRA